MYNNSMGSWDDAPPQTLKEKLLIKNKNKMKKFIIMTRVIEMKEQEEKKQILPSSSLKLKC